MISIKSFNKKKLDFKYYFDFYSYIWFRYHHLLFGRLIFRGHKIKAFNRFIGIKNYLKRRESVDPYLIFLVSMIKVTPHVFLKPLKNGRVTQNVPMPITENKKIALVVKWLAKFSKGKKGYISSKVLADNLVLSVYEKGPLTKKKLEIYKTASTNRHLIKYFK